MKPVSRKLKRHFGATAKHVAVRSKQPWYWQILVYGLLVFLGYMVAYAQLSGGDFGSLHQNVQQLKQENQDLQAKLVHSERQLQVETAAQTNLTKEMATLQDEQMHLKEDVAFYQNIMNENKQTSEVQLQGLSLSRVQQSNRYEYHLLLLQSGRHDKQIQGVVKLVISGMQDGKTIQLPVADDINGAQALKINFKYYQRLDGTFMVPDGVTAQLVEASFYEQGSVQAKLSQRVNFPN